MEKTTIQINQSTLGRLKMFKQFDRESYDEVLNNILNDVEEETLSDLEIEEIKESLEEVKQGKVNSIEEVAKEFGVKLN